MRKYNNCARPLPTHSWEINNWTNSVSWDHLAPKIVQVIVQDMNGQHVKAI